MNINNTQLEEACKFLLQKNISVEVNNKIIKSGKMILFYQKNFFLTFILQTGKKEKDKIEIPIPYDVEPYFEENLIYFDYRLKTLCKTAVEMENYLKLYTSRVKGNKYWDTIVTIDANH